MAAAYILLCRRQLRRERQFRDRNNPLDYMNEMEIVSKFRLPRHLIIDLCQMMDNDLKRPTRRSQSLPTSLQVMAALRFYATGNFQLVTADLHGISKSSVSRIVRDVSSLLSNMSPTYIKMPVGDAEINATMVDFYKIAGFPNVIGSIDGTHVAIKAPSYEEYAFVNRKIFHSINVMGVCNADLKFLNLIAKWPGSTHDSFVWSNSILWELFENKTIERGWLLGDSGYPLRPHLLTPLLNPHTAKQNAYNHCHVKTRNTIERCFGVWKMRFRSINSSGGTLLFKPEKACNIIVATAVLHNLCMEHHVPIPEDRVINDYQVNDNIYHGHQNDGSVIRAELIENIF